MQTITSISRLLVIAFSIVFIVLFLQDRSAIFFSDSSDEMPFIINHKLMMNQVQNSNVLMDILNQNVDSTLNYARKESTSIWAKIGNELKLDHASENPRVKKEMRRILSDKKSFEAILNRSAPYIYHIYSQTKERHLPSEITLIPIIESEYNPNDHNSIGASGLWQLMPGTAHIFGLKTDKCRNVVDSTNVALRFFSDLGREFDGNWDLAFAAYNCGDGRVSSAIRHVKSHNYFKLRLPQETKLYVPRLLAVAEIIKHAKKYNIRLPQIKDEPYFKKIKVKKSESLSTYAKSTGTSLETLKKLNPDYKYKRAKAGSHILVPVV